MHTNTTITVPKVRIVVFNKVSFTASLFGPTARICWKTQNSGSVLARNKHTGRFHSLPFAVA